jgi:hypothetical protein
MASGLALKMYCYQLLAWVDGGSVIVRNQQCHNASTGSCCTQAPLAPGLQLLLLLLLLLLPTQLALQLQLGCWLTCHTVAADAVVPVGASQGLTSRPGSGKLLAVLSTGTIVQQHHKTAGWLKCQLPLGHGWQKGH